jgi:hypothetical protein
LKQFLEHLRRSNAEVEQSSRTRQEEQDGGRFRIYGTSSTSVAFLYIKLSPFVRHTHA